MIPVRCRRPLFCWLLLTAPAVLSRAEGVAIPVPPGALAPVRDPGGNHWTLVPDGSGRRALQVLPAQEPAAWIPATVAGLEPGDWREIEVDPEGGVVVRSQGRAQRFDFRFPEKGGEALAEGAEVSRESTAPWHVAARFPAGIHDITAAVVAERMYVAGGLTSYHGYPAKSRAYDALWVLDPGSWRWRTAAKLHRPRIYAATAGFLERVWVIGGDVIDVDGRRRTTTKVEVFDPATGRLADGVDLPFALATPLALTAAGRLWVMGSLTAKGPGQLVSLGAGEREWRREPEGPRGMMALAGATLAEKLHVSVPEIGLVVFDPASRKWDVIGGPSTPRSPQVAAWRGELWIMGGCDVPDARQSLVYSSANGSWRTGPALPAPLSWGGAGVLADRLVVAGGAALRGAPGSLRFDFEDRTFVLSPERTAAAGRTEPGRIFTRWNDEKLRGTGSETLPYATQRIYPGLALGRLTQITSIPTNGAGAPTRRVVVDYDGDAWSLPEDETAAQAHSFLRLAGPPGAKSNLLALAFHPEFPARPYLYVLFNRWAPKPAENVLARFTVQLSGEVRADPGSERKLLVWPSDGHNGGDVRFGPDGFLYVSTGDGGPPGDVRGTGQRVDVIAGGVLRLDVDKTDPGLAYAIPRDNPFVGLPGVRPEFWAYGLRNPWRMSFAPTGELWAGDNGEDAWESIHLVRKGHNYGWSAFEGTHPYKTAVSLAGPVPRHTPPILELPHTESRSVVGGLVYRGSALPELRGHYVFGDYVTGFVWAFRWDGNAARDHRRIADTRSQIISFGEDRSGEILLTADEGRILRLVRSPEAARPISPVPARLSETGIFASTVRMTPAAGVVPYEINAGLWSNGARVQRWLALSSRSPVVVLASSAQWSLPDGTALVRTLELPTPTGRRRVETQVMYRDQAEWRFYTYAWNAEQTDAMLVGEEGDLRQLRDSGLETWRFAARAECALCHRAQAGSTLAFSTPQLNRNVGYPGFESGSTDQIRALRAMGLVHANERTLASLPRKADPADPELSVESRARAYLDVNCAHCHQAGGLAGRATLRLSDSTPLPEAGLVDVPAAVPLLGPPARLVKPGEPEASELLHRMRTKAGGRMPLIGSDVMDEQGVDLIRRWISQLRPLEGPNLNLQHD
jgi:uncharacterized repeat protein (TIGR03806 family)